MTNWEYIQTLTKEEFAMLLAMRDDPNGFANWYHELLKWLDEPTDLHEPPTLNDLVQEYGGLYGCTDEW